MITPEEIAERFDISLTAAKIRLQEIERMRRRRMGIRRPLPQGVQDFLRDAKKKGFKITSIDD